MDISQTISHKAQSSAKVLRKQMNEFAEELAVDMDATLIDLVRFGDLLIDSTKQLTKEQSAALDKVAHSGQKINAIINELRVFSQLWHENKPTSKNKLHS